jgi:hypothetical protein
MFLTEIGELPKPTQVCETSRRRLKNRDPNSREYSKVCDHSLDWNSMSNVSNCEQSRM